ncbi:hypothetical protein [Psychrilyobacter sp.]|uniref:hypothetical protein n=1 Tax=Psychrilyobacter sp. TaxID=2586924 RepID=UPI00301A1A50
MQEFFIAQKIYKLGCTREKVIKKLITDDDSSKYINILEFLYDLDNLTFENILFEELIKEIDKVFDDNSDLNEDDRELLFEYPSVFLSSLKTSELSPTNGVFNHSKISERFKQIENFKNANGLGKMNNSVNYGVIERHYNLNFSKHKYHYILKILFDRNINIFYPIPDHSNYLEAFKKFDLEEYYYYYYKNNRKDFELLKEILYNHLFFEKYRLNIYKFKKRYEELKLQLYKKNDIFNF